MLSSLLNLPRHSERRDRRNSALSPFAQSPSVRPDHADERTRLLEANQSPQVVRGHVSGLHENDESNHTIDDDPLELDDEDGPQDAAPLLPIFSAAHLDALPVYNLTHAIRILIVSKCETTLSWDQLRSPQVSQFLLKPIQQEIRASHFSRATQYALMSNCLQFNKETALNPGISGTSKTRAMVCELLAIKLLKEFSMRELIDALSYDFDPLQGQSVLEGPAAISRPGRMGHTKPRQPRPARISCLEVAIRAQAKRFLAHPLVVEQLEAIWAGSIVFHATADSLHRPTQSRQAREQHQAGLDRAVTAVPSDGITRRSVTLYDPRDASLFKLSRLRVPRYQNVLSTLSFAILLGLFLAVLIQRSLEITTLEIVFWFWCAGYILDEVVGFNEQGFGLYLASFWNTFDLGILLLLTVHLCLRLYGILMPDTRKHSVANFAYDVLAADAILLFPRLFSVLDHYRYFSQLLIAFRMMASDLIAVFVLILISCSGFFAALTLSFGDDELDKPASVAYALFQMLMGFTPAAWDRWDNYNALGKTILTLFLFICHFLVVTILITVLTNSFMAIVQNANEEHQFVFAVNTISMVKSDALFSYIAPTNIIGWFIAPLRYFVSFPRFVRINRTIIKITHVPVLFTIFLYERSLLDSSAIDAMEVVVESRGRSPGKDDVATGLNLFTPQAKRRIREASVATWRKDRALDAVFRQPFTGDARGTSKSQTRHRASAAVNNWMQNVGKAGVMSPPLEQDRAVVEHLEGRHSSYGRPRAPRRRRDFTDITRSVASDPEDFGGFPDVLSPPQRPRPDEMTPTHESPPESPYPTADDGDDEGATSGEDEDRNLEAEISPTSRKPPVRTVETQDYFSTPSPPRQPTGSSTGAPFLEPDASRSKKAKEPLKPKLVSDIVGRKVRPRPHLRHVSSATVIYNPVASVPEEGSSLENLTILTGKAIRIKTPKSGSLTPAAKSLSNTPGLKTPSKYVGPSKARPILPPKGDPSFLSAPNLAGMVRLQRRQEPIRSSLAMDLGSDIGDNKAMGGGFVGGIPASFATQMAHATGGLRRERSSSEDREIFGRLVLARMNKLEESLKEVIHEVRETRLNNFQNSPNRSKERPSRPSRSNTKRPKTRRDKRDYEKDYGGQTSQQMPQAASAGVSVKATDADQEWEDDEWLQKVKSGSI